MVILMILTLLWHLVNHFNRYAEFRYIRTSASTSKTVCVSTFFATYATSGAYLMQQKFSQKL